MVYAEVDADKSYKAENDDWRTKTFGGQFMTQCQRIGLDPSVQPRETVSLFHHFLQKYWTWTPGGKKSHGAYVLELLDGKPRSEECALAARAFAKLLTLPPPFGFGISGHRVAVEIYSGPEVAPIVGSGPEGEDIRNGNTFKAGFVSRHDQLGHFGLSPNVFDPAAAAKAPLYFWSNHKVVKLDGTFWDVCYNTSYDTLRDMAVAWVARSTSRKTVEPDPDADNECMVLVRTAGDIVYLRDPKTGSTAEASGADYEGPFGASLFGDQPTKGTVPAPNTW